MYFIFHPLKSDPTPGEHALVMIQKLRKKSNPKEFKYRMKIMGSTSISYKFNTPVDCQQLPAVLNSDGKVTSILNNFVSDPIKNQLLEMVKDDTRYQSFYALEPDSTEVVFRFTGGDYNTLKVGVYNTSKKGAYNIHYSLI